MMSSGAERLMNEAHISVSACIMNDIPNDARQAFGKSAHCFIDALSAKLEEALVEVRHLRTNAVGPPDYMRLKVRAENAERAAKLIREHIVKLSQWNEVARLAGDKTTQQKLSFALDQFCDLARKIERGPGD